MIKVKLTGHDYRYEAYQILSLFYPKDDISFVEEGWDMEVCYDDEKLIASCILSSEEGVLSEKVNAEGDSKKNVKNAIKLAILKVLQRHTGVTMPWGILVGIRPTKLIHDSSLSEAETIKHLMEYYAVSREKAFLTAEVAEKEASILHREPGAVSLYMHIPFCPTRCVYCSFTSNPVAKNEQLIDEYIDALKKEASSALEEALSRGVKFDTFYIGGGTPTALSASQLDDLLGYVGSIIDLKGLREFTVEAGRPDSIEKDKLQVLKDYGCTRISINPQTMNDETLKRIGRRHTSGDIVDKYLMARDVGFDCINMDMIIGLPGEGYEEMLHTVKEIIALQPDNITVHTMAIKRASILNEKKYFDHDQKLMEAYNDVSSEIKSSGMYPYYMYRQKNMVLPLENIGYCRVGKEGIYNVQMIAESISILALGADAVTKLVYPRENRIERVGNVKDVREYIKRIDEMAEKKKDAIKLLDLG
jgi:oxygen-independent coproporphyrinogen-3 oxidase